MGILRLGPDEESERGVGCPPPHLLFKIERGREQVVAGAGGEGGGG